MTNKEKEIYDLLKILDEVDTDNEFNDGIKSRHFEKNRPISKFLRFVSDETLDKIVDFYNTYSEQIVSKDDLVETEYKIVSKEKMPANICSVEVRLDLDRNGNPERGNICILCDMPESLNEGFGWIKPIYCSNVLYEEDAQTFKEVADIYEKYKNSKSKKLIHLWYKTNCEKKGK